jgi:hypothetical protein
VKQTRTAPYATPVQAPSTTSRAPPSSARSRTPARHGRRASRLRGALPRRPHTALPHPHGRGGERLVTLVTSPRTSTPSPSLSPRRSPRPRAVSRRPSSPPSSRRCSRPRSSSPAPAAARPRRCRAGRLARRQRARPSRRDPRPDLHPQGGGRTRREDPASARAPDRVRARGLLPDLEGLHPARRARRLRPHRTRAQSAPRRPAPRDARSPRRRLTDARGACGRRRDGDAPGHTPRRCAARAADGRHLQQLRGPARAQNAVRST